MPSRSMVLKVVTGKILETWELRSFSAQGELARYRKQTIQIFLPPVVRGKILETWELRRFRAARGSVLGTADVCQIVKDRRLSYR